MEQLKFHNGPARPFLKWVGGKSQLLPVLMARVRAISTFRNYHEPFVGGGALFFHLQSIDVLRSGAGFLSDCNPNLINTYDCVQNDVEDLIELLQSHEAQHSHEYYYQMRANVPRGRLHRAARLIYLNKTCFNGLYRENSKGEFNVPMGRYKTPRICDTHNLRAASDALKTAHIDVRHFRTVLKKAKSGDLVYFDPPYWPVSPTSSFTSYARENFSIVDQEELASVFRSLTQNGVHAMASNSYTPFIRNLYKDFQQDRVEATRSINSKGGSRGKVSEIIIRNF